LGVAAAAVAGEQAVPSATSTPPAAINPRARSVERTARSLMLALL
jgi:hypothetical protein